MDRWPNTLGAAGIPVLARAERPLEMRGGLCARAGAALQLLAHAAEIRTLVRAAEPRAVVAWYMRSGIAGAAALLRLDRRGLRPPLIFQQSDFLPVGATAYVVRLAARAADRVIVNSAAVASDLAYGGRCSVVYVGIDVDAYDATPLPPGPPRVLLLGAVVPIKRPRLALEAGARAARELPELRLVVAGHHVGGRSKQLLSELRRRAEESDLAGRVEFAGCVNDPRETLAQCRCLLLCADREAFGLVIVEAMEAAASDVIPCAPVPDEEPGRGLTLVTVTHNSAADLDRFLRSVAPHLPGATVVIADSGSDDASLAVARGWSGHARVIELGENVGYGRAPNAGVAAADIRACVATNPDVELVGDSLAALAAEATRRGTRSAPRAARPSARWTATGHGPRRACVRRRRGQRCDPAGGTAPPLRRRLEP